MLEAVELHKSFGPLKAVAGLSFQADRGETVGLLGPNGAGKTTTISMLAGLMHPDSGAVRVNGASIWGDTNPAKREIGLVPQELALYDELPARTNLQLFASLYGATAAQSAKPIDDALDLVGLTDRAGDRVADFSGGMKRRLNLAAALLHDPQVLLLDEPTVGVDPQSRNAIFDNLETLKARGKTIVYTTHYMEEAERLCDRILIVDRGTIIANDSVPALLRTLPAANLLRVTFAEHSAMPDLDRLHALTGVQHAELRDGTLTVSLADLSSTVPIVLADLAMQRCSLQHISTEKPTLEDVFLSLTGRSLRDV